MRKGNFLKTMVFSLGVAAMLLPAKTLNAQDRPGDLFGTNVPTEQSNAGLFRQDRPGGLFGTNVPTEQSNAGLFRQGTGGGGFDGGFFIHPQTFFDGENYFYNLFNVTFEDVTPEEVPLGSGLFIMAAAGAGYALKKRKDNKKQ